MSNVRIAQAYLGLYVDLCICRLSQSPSGASDVMRREPERSVNLLVNAKEMNIEPKAYVSGIVDQLLFEGKKPIHCMGLCSTQGLEIYKRYADRTSRSTQANQNTVQVMASKDLRDRVILDILAAREIVGYIYSGLSVRPFCDNWSKILSEKRADGRLRHTDDVSNIPAVFKYLAADVWCLFGRALPTVGDEYIALLNDPDIVARFNEVFPRQSSDCHVERR